MKKHIKIALKILVTLTLILFQKETNAQKTFSKQYMDSMFTMILFNDGVLVKEADKTKVQNTPYWEGRSSRKKYLEGEKKLKDLLLSNYFNPNLDGQDSISKNLVFPTKTIGFLGSYVIKNDDLAILSSPNIPELPVLSTQDELSILNPFVSNYKLNMNVNSVFKGIANGNIDLTNPAVKLQASLSSTISDERRTNLTIAVGLFENKLAQIIQSINLNDFKNKDFIPLYYVWNLYRNNTIVAGDNCLKSFRGLCYTNIRTQNQGSDVKLDSRVDASGSFPLVSLGGNASANWERTSNQNSTWNAYNVIMFEKPQTVPFPSIAAIKNQWIDITKRLKNSVTSTAKDFYLPYNGNLTVKVTFGPLPSDNVALNNVTIDKNYTFNSLIPKGDDLMISDLYIDYSNVVQTPESTTFPVVLIPNQRFFETVNNRSNLNLDIPLRLYLNSVNNTDTLDVKYTPFTINTDRKPTPYTDNTSIKSDSKANGIYHFSPIILIDPPTPGNFQLIVTGADRPFISGIRNLDQINNAIKSKIQASFNPLPNGSIANSFKMEFAIDSSSLYDVLSANNNTLNLNLEFKDQNQHAFTYNKLLSLNVETPAEVLNAKIQSSTGSLAFNTNQALIKSIDPALVVKNIGDSSRTTVGNLIEKAQNSSNKAINTQIVNEIKKSTDLMISPNNTYIISSKFLKKD